MRRLKIAIAAAGLVVLALGLAVLPLQSAPFTRVLVDRFSVAEQAGLTNEQTLMIAEQVRAYVVWGRGELPETYAGTEAFDSEMTGHLDDVRNVLLGSQMATLVLALVLVLWGAAESRRGRVGDVARALKFSGITAISLVLVTAAAAVIDFDAFFTLFHQVFFSAGTWTFPWDSLLIRLFPEDFWASAGLAWAVAIVLVSGVYLLVARAVRAQSGADSWRAGETGPAQKA